MVLFIPFALLLTQVLPQFVPMFEQSVAWKGRLAADVILAIGKDAG